MERGKQVMTSWKPTRAQKQILEGAYQLGEIHPTPERIHQLTLRLSEYGNVEPRDVYLWFDTRRRKANRQVLPQIVNTPSSSVPDPTAAAAAAAVARNTDISTEGFFITSTISSKFNIPVTLHSHNIIDHAGIQNHLKQLYKMVGHLYWFATGGASTPFQPQRGESSSAPAPPGDRTLDLFPISTGDIPREENTQHGNHNDEDVGEDVDLNLSLKPRLP